MAIITAFSLLAVGYICLFIFKNYCPRLAEQLYQKWGFDIGLFQWKWTFSARGRWITNIATTRRCKNFYKYGTFFSCLLILPGLLFLAANLLNISLLLYNSMITDAKDPNLQVISTDELVFQPVIPGVTLPLADVGIYATSLLVCTIFHEFGHALAADCQDVKLLGYGLFVIFVIPAAFVDLSTAELSSLAPSDQLKVYTAGVWHNIALSSIAYGLILSYPYLLLPSYHHLEGVLVADLKWNSTVTGPSGLEIGNILTSVNDCPIKSAKDFHFCLQNRDKVGYCFDTQQLDQLQCTHCCVQNNSSYLNFKSSNNVQGQEEFCLHVRTAINSSAGFCQSNCVATHQQCVFPQLLFPHESLWHIKRKDQGEEDKRDFLFIGYPSDLYAGITAMSDFVPKYPILPLTLPIILEKLLYYTCSFSLALGLINIVPCTMLDGQYVAKTIGRIFWQSEHQSVECFSKYLIWIGTTLILSNLGLTFFAMKFM